MVDVPEIFRSTIRRSGHSSKSYNKRDVEVEMAIQKRLSKYPVPDFIWDEYHLDQEINDRGIALDMDVVENAITFDERSKAALSETMQDITGVENPNSVVQMKAWLSENGVEAESLGKKDVAKLIDDTDGQVEEALRLRLQLCKIICEEIPSYAERCMQGWQSPRHVPILRSQPLRQMGRQANTVAEPSAESHAGSRRSQSHCESGRL